MSRTIEQFPLRSEKQTAFKHVGGYSLPVLDLGGRCSGGTPWVPTFSRECGVASGCPPDGCAHNRGRFRRPGIGQHIPFGITASEVTRPQGCRGRHPDHVGCVRALVGTGRTPIENSDWIILEETCGSLAPRSSGTEVMGERATTRSCSRRSGVGSRPFSDCHHSLRILPWSFVVPR